MLYIGALIEYIEIIEKMVATLDFKVIDIIIQMILGKILMLKHIQKSERLHFNQNMGNDSRLKLAGDTIAKKKKKKKNVANTFLLLWCLFHNIFKVLPVKPSSYQGGYHPL